MQFRNVTGWHHMLTRMEERQDRWSALAEFLNTASPQDTVNFLTAMGWPLKSARDFQNASWTRDGALMRELCLLLGWPDPPALPTIHDRAEKVRSELDELNAWWEGDQDPERLPEMMKDFQAVRAGAGQYTNEYGLAGKWEDGQGYLAVGKGYIHYGAVQDGETTHHEWQAVDFETYKLAFQQVRNHQFSREPDFFPMWIPDTSE